MHSRDPLNGAQTAGDRRILAPSLSRRAFVRLGAAGLASVALGHAISPPGRALAQVPTAAGAPAPRAGACILLWMNGGPSHIDTFDPKPGSRNAGEFKAIKTSVPGVQLSEHLPQVAAQAHRLAICRGVTSREGNHQRAQHLLHTGYAPNPTVSHPSLGAWVSEELGDPGFDLPHFMSIGGVSAGGGFLGQQHSPFIVQNPSQPPSHLATPRGVDAARARSRGAALAALEAQFAGETGDTKVQSRRAVYEKAGRMMSSPRLDAFNLDEEPEATRAAYGDTDFGRGCLMARRLVESGVQFVEVVLDGWDTHQNNFERTRKLMGTLDPAMATLVKDLEQRKLLDRTLVVWMGEFGRTPRISADEGRDHHPGAWSAVLAGGGIRPGIVHGQTDADGERVVRDPVVVPDLFATLASLLGLDPGKSRDTPLGRPIAITDSGVPIGKLIS